MKRLLPAFLTLCFFGLGCLVTARTIPSDAKPVFNGFISAIRSADAATLETLLCADQNRQAIIASYQHMPDEDRSALADALAAATPDDTSSDTQLNFQVQPNPTPGSPTYRYLLTKSTNGWCVED